MEFLLILLPLLAAGLVFGSDSHSDSGVDPDEVPVTPDPQGNITRDADSASTLNGDASPDLIFGAGGADTISGAEGVDFIAGETGADSIFGNAGNDVLLGAWGNDQLFGGVGDDVLVGGAGNDALTGDAGDDLLLGSSGRDTLIGGDGNDELVGFDFRAGFSAAEIANLDTAELNTGLNNAFAGLTNSDFQRVLVGFTNAGTGETVPDLLDGGNGNDVLVGDDGDIMRGGAGIDEFAVLSTAGGDVVNIDDFDPAVEALAVLVNGPVTGALTFANDAVGDGLDVLLDGVRVANLEGVFADQIRPGSLTLERLS